MFAKSAPGHREPAEPLKPIVDPAGWYPAAMAATDSWIYPLSSAEIAEVADVAARLESRGVDIVNIRREDFPLPRLRHGLGDIRDELLDGRGFVLIRGLPAGEWSRLQTAIAYWGIGTHLGQALSQNASGHMLGHVKDLGGDYSDPKTRGYLTSARMGFHADQCDFVALLCLHPAKSGGASRIASSVTLYNELLKRRPDLVAELVQDFYWTRHGEIAPGQLPWFRLPIFSFERGYMSARGVSSYIFKSQGLPGVPKFTTHQMEALDMYRSVVEEIALDMMFEQGDIQILHNHVILHSRAAFQDWPEPERKRHLYRLWLRDDHGRPLLKTFRDHIRGIQIEGFVPTAPLDPEIAGVVA